MSINGTQVTTARALLKWSRVRLAVQADISLIRIAEFESGKRSSVRLSDRLKRALEAAGVEFTNGGQPGVRMKEAK